MKNLTYILLIIMSLLVITACSSPEEKAAGYLENGTALLKAGKLRKAEIEYKNALQINQNLADAWYGLAQIHERRQEWRQTYVILNKISEMFPKHVAGRIKLGQILLASNQLDKALLQAKDMLELAPDDARSHALMAAVQYRLDNLDGALLEIDKALKIQPENSEALLILARIHISKKEYVQAQQVLDKGLKANPENVSLYLMKILAYDKAGDLPASESVYLKLISQFPENTSYMHSLANFYVKNKELDKAATVYEKIVSKNPDDVDERLKFVSFTRQNKSVQQSINLLKDYIQQNEDEFRYKFALAELYEQNEKQNEAISIYQDIIESDKLQPNGLSARIKLAQIELNSGNRDKAERLVNQVLEKDKNNELALLMRSGFKLSDKLYDDAIVDLRTILRDNPQSIKALILLARAYELNDSSELAQENYTKAFRLNPGLPVIANKLAGFFIINKKYSQADEVLEESFAKGNKTLVALKLLVQVKLFLKEWDAAEKIAKLLQNVKGQEALSQQVMGIIYQAKQREEDSIVAFKKAYELSPSSTQPVVALVRTYVRGGKIDEAKSFLQSILSVNTNNTMAYTLLGQLSLYEKNPEKAEEYFKKSIEVAPKETSGYRTLARMYASDNRIDLAEKVLKEGLTIKPESIELSMSIASIYERQHNFDKAIEVYEKLLQQSPELIIAKNNLASLLTDYRTDKVSLKKAQAISAEFKDSKIPYFRDTYAWVLVKSGQQIEEAVTILQGVVKEANNNPIFHYHLGKAFKLKGNDQKAIEHLKLAIKMGGENASFYQDAVSIINSLS